MNFWVLLALVAGLVYGYVNRGKEDRWALLKKGVVYGIILGIVFGFIGFFLGSYHLGSLIGGAFLFAAGAIGTFIYVVVLAIIFIIGTFIGDLVESALKK